MHTCSKVFFTMERGTNTHCRKVFFTVTRGQAHTAGVCLHCGEGVQCTLQEGVGQGASAHCRKGFLNQGEEVGIPSLWIGQQSLLAGYFLYYGQRTSVQCRRMCLVCTGGVPSLWVGGQEYTAGWYSFTDNRTSTLQEGMPSLRRGGQAHCKRVCLHCGEGDKHTARGYAFIAERGTSSNDRSVFFHGGGRSLCVGVGVCRGYSFTV